MDFSELISKLKSDPPFSYPHPDERTKALLVETSSVKLFKKELEIRVQKFMRQRSGITNITGRARSGKTHFIYNLDYITNTKHEYPGLVVYLPLFGEDMEFGDLVRKIVENPEFQKRSHEIGLDTDKFKGVELIVQFIKELQVKHGNKAGIILAIDNVDEHFRQREAKAREQGITPKEDIQRFLGLFRLLIGEGKVDKGLCIIFSLTDAADDKLENYLSDPTLRERFDFIYDPADPGNKLKLSALSEDEAIMMVGKYMKYWSDRNSIALPVVKECLVNDQNIWPFTKEAVLLFWKAGSFAGHICLGCSNVLERKEGIITGIDAAETISASAGSFPNFPPIREEISNLIGGPTLEAKTNEWIETTARTKYSGDMSKADFRGSFKNYLESIAKVSKENMEIRSDITIINPYTHESSTLEMQIRFKERLIGISFVKAPIVSDKDGKALTWALKNRDVTHGMFVYAGKEPELDFKGGRKAYLTSQLISSFRDIGSGFDYNSVIKLKLIDEISAWGIIRGNEIKDFTTKTKMYGWLESRILILSELENLSSAEPRKLPRQPSYRPGELLSKGGA